MEETELPDHLLPSTYWNHKRFSITQFK